MSIKATDDEGNQVDAYFHVNKDEEGLFLILESRSGRGRNPEYAKGLGLLLSRLADAGAELTQVRVESEKILHLPAESRVITPPQNRLPLALGSLNTHEMESLRSQIRNNQRNIGAGPSTVERPPSGAWRRIRLNFRLPVQREWTVRSLTDHLQEGHDLGEFAHLVEEEERALNLKDTDAVAQARRRLEQGPLRKFLGLKPGAPPKPCALCGRPYEARFLIASHIKPRSKCTHDERLDARNIVMAACKFGCDTLYDGGFVFVDAEGVVRARPTALTANIDTELQRCVGKTCLAYRPATAPYFAYHRDHVGLETP